MVSEKAEKKLTGAEKRRLRKRRRKLERQEELANSSALESAAKRVATGVEEEGQEQEQEQEPSFENGGIEVEYISAPRDFSLLEIMEVDVETENKPEAAVEVKDEIDREEELGYGGLGLGAGLGAGPGLGLDSTKTDPEKPPPKSNGAEPMSRVDIVDDLNRIFNHFATAEDLTGSTGSKAGQDKSKPVEKMVVNVSDEEGDKGGDADGEEDENLSKRKRKLGEQLKIAELKQICSRPEVVEVWDVTAADPKILVYLKAYRNSVPVPRHWSQKRKYLQGKRGIEKPPFQLPDFIEATGISMMRQAYQEKEEAKKLKQKQRDRMQPKLGKMDIDYTILHDAFFKYQTKPSLTRMGDLYYEGKEFEARVTDIKPGSLSSELQKALGMSDGAPPPWLINMQRYGPPPSYPSLKISGLNAPIPPAASFGYHPGGWGKPPVDEEGRPLYGDVFGQYDDRSDSDIGMDKLTRWGDLDSEAEESSEEEDADEEESEDQSVAEEDAATTGTQSVASGFASSLPSGVETPDMIDLRKVDRKQKQLYTVLEQKEANIGQGNLMGSDHVYVLPGAENAAAAAKNKWPVGAGEKKKAEGLQKIGTSDVDITLDPEELEGLDESAIKSLYEEKLADAREKVHKDDFSDMVAAKAREQKKRIAARESAKKKETFKF